MREGVGVGVVFKGGGIGVIILLWISVLFGWGDCSFLSSSSSSSSSSSPLGDDLLCHPACDCLDAYFDCRKRGLEQFPMDFPNWIQKLNISNNLLLEVDLSRLPQLTYLSLDGNNLTEVPNSPIQLKHLLILSLSRNGISGLSGEELGTYTTLQELDLSRNRIEQLNNSSFPPNSSLHILNLGANQIEGLESGCLSGLVFLEELNLSRNRIKSIPKELFSQIKNLQRLDLSRNRLEVLDSLRFQELKKLTSLNLRRNHITNLSDASFYGLDKLHSLYLDGNLIRVVEKRWLYGLRSLRTLNLSRNAVERIEDDSWEFMEELINLDLSHNKLKSLQKNWIKGLSRLRHLDLSSNSILSIQTETFLWTERLEVLDLSYNNLSWAIEDSEAGNPFKGLKDLNSLNLAGNQFQTLSGGALKGLGSLKNLNLSLNPLKWLSSLTFGELPFLTLQLYFKGPSFVCDCEAAWLHSKLISNERNQVFLSHSKDKQRSRSRGKGAEGGSKTSAPICEYPLNLQGRLLTELSTQDLICTDQEESRPKFTLQPKTQTLLLDGNGSLSCEALGPVQIYWTKEHLRLPSDRVQNFERISNLNPPPSNETIKLELSSTLHLINVSWEDVGGYQCVAQNHLGIIYSSKANLSVQLYPAFTKRPSNVTVRLGLSAKLECGAKGAPPPEIAFQKDGGENVPAALDRRFHVMPNDDSFIIMDIKLMDAGEYCCFARNDAGEIRACAQVTVFETPSFVSRMKDERVVEGSNTVLECTSKGSPKPQISWSKDQVLLLHPGDEGDRLRIKDGGAFLIIKDVRLEDGGRYECLSSNAVGTARDALTLTVIPSDGGDSWNSPIMIYALVCVAGACVVATIVAWVVVICRDRRKGDQGGAGDVNGGTNSLNLRHSIIRYEDLLELEGGHGGHSVILNTSLVGVGDGGSQSSGKDSGTGEELEIIGPPDPTHELEQESLMRHSWRKPELETFSTFGGGGLGRGKMRISPAGVKGLSSCCDVISVPLQPGREFCTLSMPRKVGIPVPPPFLNLKPPTEGGPGFGSSSSGYSSLGGGGGPLKPTNIQKFEEERKEILISGENGALLNNLDGSSSSSREELSGCGLGECEVIDPSEGGGEGAPAPPPQVPPRLRTTSPISPIKAPINQSINQSDQISSICTGGGGIGSISTPV